VTDKKCNYCVLAGFAAYETKPYWIEQALNNIVNKYFSIIQNCFDTDGTEIHGLHMLV
jgi:hypothetical protein